MKLVYSAESLIDAQLVVDILHHAGIASLLLNQNAMGGFGDLPMTYPEVWIKRDRDENKARREIIRFENRPLPATNRACTVCTETNPATFEICWRCYTPLN